ncbi:MAG: hypothetical protein ACAI34_14915, partial [Verrucomicrobium sp.]
MVIRSLWPGDFIRELEIRRGAILTGSVPLEFEFVGKVLVLLPSIPIIMKSSRRHQFLLFFVFLLTTPPGVICGQNLLVNGGFEEPGGFTNYALLNENVFPGWDTEGADSLIEIWQNGFEEYSYGPVPAYEGGYFAEVNGTSNIGFYQDFITPETGFLDYSFAHRGRLGVDTMR